MRLIIAGTRTFDDYDFLKKQMYYAFRNETITKVLSGGAKGADALGERWAFERTITVAKYYPDWNKHGRSAGPIRNKEMAENADACIVFWDGESKGTASMIKEAKAKNLKLFIINYNLPQL